MTLDIRTPRPIARTRLSVSPFGFGTVFIGDPDELTSDAQAEATLEAAWQAGIRYFDTAPWYGNTLSEHRLGRFLYRRPRTEYAISTKIGRVYRRPADPASFDFPRWKGGLHFELRFDYTRDGVQRSYEDSLQRLGINCVDALAIHDLDFKHQKDEATVRKRLDELDAGGGFRALEALKRAGEIRAIGAGINHVGMIPRFLERFEMDYFLVAMPYTLLDQPALEAELPLCQLRGVSVVIGAVFASGILATGAAAAARYGYQPAQSDVLERVQRIESVCAAHRVPLAAAALQFPLHHPAVAAIIPGANTPEQVRDNAAHLARPIPDALWSDLKAQGLLHPKAPAVG